jgi:type IX secretion system PorP/SprF family membrane protein
MRTSKIILLAIATVAMVRGRAQDAHLSQYEAAPVLLNPALTGMFEQADFRMSCNLRNQWSHLSSDFLTTAFSYDAAINNQYGAGMYVSNYDMAGMLNTFEAGLAGSYNVSQKKAKHTLSVGLKAGIIYKKVNDADLLFDHQYNDGYFDSDLPTGEELEKKGRLMPELGLGFAYRSNDASRMLNPFGNFAAFHLTTPDETIFRVVKQDLPIRWSFMGGVAIKVSEELRLSPMGLFMLQGKNQEINAGMMGEFVIGGSAYSALFGGSYRLQDAVIAHLGMKHRNSAFRLSYDIIISPLSEFTNKMGAFEFSFMYTRTLPVGIEDEGSF